MTQRTRCVLWATEEGSREPLVRAVQERGWKVVAKVVDARLPGAIDRLLEIARSGFFDVLVMPELPTMHVQVWIRLWCALHRHGKECVSLREPWFSLDMHGELIRWFATVEAGIADAKASGKRIGRPPIIIPEEQVLGMRAEGISQRGIARKTGLTTGTIHRFLKRKGFTGKVARSQCD